MSAWFRCLANLFTNREIKQIRLHLKKTSKTMRSHLIILGTGTCQITKRRMASSVLLDLGELKVVYDFGHGICQRILEAGYKNNDINHIILSHFHPDHFSDLIPVLHASSYSKTESRTHDLNIYGPVGAKKLINGLVGLVRPGELILQKQYNVSVREITENTIEINGFTFDFIELPPREPIENRGLRFEINRRIYAITGDSKYHQQEIDFLKNAFLGIINSGVLTDEEIVDLAVKTQVQKLVCSHLYRELDREKLQKEAERQGYKGEIIVGEDLMSFEL